MDTQSQKKNVKVLNSRGFTLLEMLLSFSIFLIIVSFLPSMIQIIINNRPIEMRNQRMEWEVFISQVKKEVRMSNKITINTQSLLLETNGKVILYEKYGTNMRRRVDYKGHEIMIQNVISFEFEMIPNGVRLTLVDVYGREYLEEIHAFVSKGVT